MEIPKTYNPKDIENKWYQYWLEQNFFRSVPDKREAYTIVIPPPNVTGVLHMGHMLNNTLQDVLIRRARLLGKNACWVPGTDHASIATEAKVVQFLREKGIKKSDLSREDFLKYAWEWKEKYGGIILEQLKKLGASCDWERTAFTMDEKYYRDVVNVFVELYEKGLIYRGLRMVNWDPVAKTTVSDEEVFFRQTSSKMVYAKYMLEDGSSHITVATVRPETIMGDVAVAVHPSDERYQHLKGKKVIVPLVNRAVPVIFDEAIDKEFGTGCLKVTPAHDLIDYEIGQRHNLEVIDVLNEDGTISEAGQVFVGLDRFVARKKAIQKLEEDGLLEKMEDYSHQVGCSERTDAVIEPRLSLQWYLKMKEISKPAYDAVVNNEVKLIPGKFVNTYKHWMENVRDWCLSRQLWWGHRIPAWYDENGNFVVAATHNEALKKYNALYPEKSITQLRQDDDVLDTWASSWIWPISVFNGFEKPDGEIKYYYPTNDLVTAPEILFFWVARMIIAGYEFKNEKPFQNVYLTGIVRDKQGRKMSKSLGNSPDPLELINKYGADGVRVGMLLCSPAGNDLLFDESYCEQGRNFSNKIWNAFRLVKMWEISETEQPEINKTAVKWFEEKFNEQLNIINEQFNKYRISEALMTTYKLVWDDFCAWYLELIKPEFIDGKSLPIDKATYESTLIFFEKLLKVLHPFMPFITEEIWHLLKERNTKESIMVASFPEIKKFDSALISKMESLKELVTVIRNLRQQKNISPKEKLSIFELQKNTSYSAPQLIPFAVKLANLESYDYTAQKIEGAYSFIIGTTEYFVPLQLNNQEEKTRLLKELDYNKGFLLSVQKKLANEKFVQNAKPELVELERKKFADAQAKIKSLEEALAALK